MGYDAQWHIHYWYVAYFTENLKANSSTEEAACLGFCFHTTKDSPVLGLLDHFSFISTLSLPLHPRHIAKLYVLRSQYGSTSHEAASSLLANFVHCAPFRSLCRRPKTGKVTVFLWHFVQVKSYSKVFSSKVTEVCTTGYAFKTASGRMAKYGVFWGHNDPRNTICEIPGATHVAAMITALIDAVRVVSGRLL